MRKYFGPSSCIATTRVVTNVFEHYGFEAFPVHVDVTVWNPAWVSAIKRGEQPPYELGQNSVHQWMDDRGAWSVSTQLAGADAPIRHLVAFIPSLSALIDASIDQCNRRQRGINLPECVAFQVKPELLLAEYVVQIEESGCWIEYRRVMDGGEPWRLSPDWIVSARAAKVQNALIRRIEKRIVARR